MSNLERPAAGQIPDPGTATPPDTDGPLAPSPEAGAGASGDHGRRQGSRLAAAQRESDAIDRLVRRVLAAGLTLSALLLCTGFILWLARGGDVPSAVQGPLTAARSMAALEPVGFFSYGLLVLILTPFVRVAGSVVIFFRERDWRFAVVTALVLLSMIAGLVVGSL